MLYTKPITKETVNALKKGDTKAFELVFYDLFEPLVNFATEYLNDIEASKNIVQNIFMKLWEIHELVDPDQNLKSYLYITTRNSSLSYLRRLKTEKKYGSGVIAKNELLSLNYDALNDLNLEKIDLDNLESIINQTIDSLPERCREVFMLSRFGELKNKEIAEKLNISIKAVEANISRALTKLRQNSKDYLPEIALFLFFTNKF